MRGFPHYPPSELGVVTPLLLLSSEDNLMNCLPVCLSVNVYDPELHRKLWSWSSNVSGKRRLPGAPGLLGIR